MGRKNITFGGQEVTLIGTEIKVGERAPNFKSIKQDLSEYDFYEESKNKIKIISVAPSLDTKICSDQAVEFNKIAESLKDDILIINITADLPFAQKKFCVKENINNIDVISDHKYLDFGGKYGFVIKEMRILARGVVIVDSNNIVRYVEYTDEINDHVNFNAAKKEIKKISDNK